MCRRCVADATGTAIKGQTAAPHPAPNDQQHHRAHRSRARRSRALSGVHRDHRTRSPCSRRPVCRRCVAGAAGTAINGKRAAPQPGLDGGAATTSRWTLLHIEWTLLQPDAAGADEGGGPLGRHVLKDDPCLAHRRRAAVVGSRPPRTAPRRSRRGRWAHPAGRRSRGRQGAPRRAAPCVTARGQVVGVARQDHPEPAPDQVDQA